ncbi:Signal transduction histidine kinase [Amphritea atlantica]|uniref:histidine kinase n=1 Tax=Amphritea atlantica TaxID=355243 RepID=A0A1H9JT43_9GAMM|nr:sensor histidine kinase [Amphritea atlantica]SEQ90191.1 Signal transduction histidine kinase [Amphritea atlantica]
MSREETSLEKKIRRGLMLLMVPAFVCLLLLLHLTMARITDEYVGSRLGDDVENILMALQWTDAGWQVDESQVGEAFKRVGSGHYFIIRWDSGQLRAGSLSDPAPDVRLLPPGQQLQFQIAGPAETQWMVRQQGVRKAERDLTIWVAEDITAFITKQNEYEYSLLTILVGLTLLIMLLQRRILHWGFASLKPMQTALLKGKIDGALDLPQGIPVEVKPLADAIERLIEHSRKQLSRSRSATSNLAHEMKLPLEHLLLLAEATEVEDNRDNLKQIYSQLQRRIEGELRRAKISGSPAPMELFNPQEELPYLVQILNRKREGQEIEVVQHIPDFAIPFDRDDMLELVGNLLDNAWRYANSRVLLSIRENRGFWTIIVSDDGPGIAPECIEDMIPKNQQDTSDGSNNHRMGLSICHSVVSSYGGKMQLHAARLGGLQVIIDIPLAGSESQEGDSDRDG